MKEHGVGPFWPGVAGSETPWPLSPASSYFVSKLFETAKGKTSPLWFCLFRQMEPTLTVVEGEFPPERADWISFHMRFQKLSSLASRFTPLITESLCNLRQVHCPFRGLSQDFETGL